VEIEAVFSKAKVITWLELQMIGIFGWSKGGRCGLQPPHEKPFELCLS
jgi:hypothetical protein